MEQVGEEQVDPLETSGGVPSDRERRRRAAGTGGHRHHQSSKSSSPSAATSAIPISPIPFGSLLPRYSAQISIPRNKSTSSLSSGREAQAQPSTSDSHPATRSSSMSSLSSTSPGVSSRALATSVPGSSSSASYSRASSSNSLGRTFHANVNASSFNSLSTSGGSGGSIVGRLGLIKRASFRRERERAPVNIAASTLPIQQDGFPRSHLTGHTSNAAESHLTDSHFVPLVSPGFQPPESFPFADYPLEPSSPTSVVKRRRWVRPSDRTSSAGQAGAVGFASGSGTGTGSAAESGSELGVDAGDGGGSGGICSPMGFAARMASLRPLRPCLVSRRRFSAAGSEAIGSSSAGGDSTSGLPTPEGSRSIYSGGMLSSSSLGMESPGLFGGNGHALDAIWSPALQSPPFSEGGIPRESSMVEPTQRAVTSRGEAVAGASEDSPRTEEQEEVAEVEEYMLKGLYGTKPKTRSEGRRRSESTSETREPLGSDSVPSNNDVPVGSGGGDILSCSETSTIMPSSSLSSLAGLSATFKLDSTTATPTFASSSAALSLSPPPADEEPEYMCEYEYLFAISAYNAAASARGLGASRAAASTSSSGADGSRSRRSTASDLSGSDVEDGRPRRKVHFPMAPERLGETALCSLYPTYSPHEYDRTPLEPPSEQERSCRLPARGSRCFLDEVDAAAIDGPVNVGLSRLDNADVEEQSCRDEGWDGGDVRTIRDTEIEAEELEQFEMDAVEPDAGTPLAKVASPCDDDAWEDWLDRRQKNSIKPACSPSMSSNCGGFSRFGEIGEAGPPCSPLRSQFVGSSLASPCIEQQSESGHPQHVEFKVPNAKQMTFDELLRDEDLASDTPSLASTFTATSTCPSAVLSHPDIHTDRLSEIDMESDHADRQAWLPHPAAKLLSTPDEADLLHAESDQYHDTPTKVFKKPGKKGKRKNAFCRASTWANRLGNFSAEELGFGSSSSGFGTPEDDGVLGGF